MSVVYDNDGERLLTTNQAASLYGIKASALRQRRYRGGTPEHLDVEGRVYYRECDILAVVDGCAE